jgi:ABC-type iron transport system FetAB ATPase subunit
MCPQKKSLERIAKLEKDQEFLRCEVERVSNEKQVAADLVRKLSSDKKGLIDEKRSFIKENKKLHARIKILEQSVVDHQEVS